MALEHRHLATYQELFCHRRDLYALQRSNGAYFLKQAPVSPEVIRVHLLGGFTAGFYALTPDNTTRWVALDADKENGLAQLQWSWQELATRGIPSHLESSRRGGHLWILFEPIRANLARRLIMGCLPELQVELFPKRDQLDDGARYGNLVRGPLGIHRRTGQRYPFVDPISLQPVSKTVVGTLEYLAEVERISVDRVAELLDALPQPVEPSPGPARTARVHVSRHRRYQTPIERLKDRLGDPYTFISRYVELDASGRGHCPFHPPDHHPSFAVNRADGYWVDFHEIDPRTGRYVGGDAIAFYRRLRELSYKEVLAELDR